ncbi:MAG: TetR/AcrR family transcriptional regulator [Fluviicoccus sp.]|uniref:TetR/AcrR family transcriptional regulator n=1 Tax=Fluviicoccus sp. TaxID=2003552 RepID=UPI002716FBC9|nr:TetR/AcrR family transcriptional regulator [Fluviicoccus sp.]MDO8332276.1 TetR/AcrR family transcriptional regulator [Fluviicoccus sp.]
MRKQPRQARSRLMVDSLIDATALTIAEHGLGDATTARIAETAGISIGSLYQYFDGKEALYAALLDRIVAQLLALVDTRSATLAQQPLRTWVKDLLNDVWDYLEAENGLYLKVLRNWSQLDFMRGIDALEQKLLGVLSLYALQRAPVVSQADLPARIYILINSVLFTLVRYISQPSPLVSREALIAAFGEMVERELG